VKICGKGAEKLTANAEEKKLDSYSALRNPTIRSLTLTFGWLRPPKK
jgi:hypothetical protein